MRLECFPRRLDFMKNATGTRVAASVKEEARSVPLSPLKIPYVRLPSSKIYQPPFHDRTLEVSKLEIPVMLHMDVDGA